MDRSLREALQRIELRRAWLAKMRRFDPLKPGRFVPRESRNRYFHDGAIRIEKLPDGAEAWIGYSGLREAAIRYRAEKPELFVEPEIEPEIRAAAEAAGLSAHIFRPFSMADVWDPDILNGYVAFPKRRAPRPPKDLEDWIPVHGGITYRAKDSFAAVWGFDTGHGYSYNVPRKDPEWILYQCQVLHYCLVAGAKIARRWERADRAGRITLADKLQAIVAGGDLGTGAMLRMMFDEI